MVSGNRTSRFLSEINVTPFVDVMLVLLIIFMVTAPMMQEGVDVNLPQAKGQSLPSKDQRMIITITKKREIYLNARKMELADLETTLRKIFVDRVDKAIFLEADEAVPYGFVVKVMAAVRGAGIEQLGMVTVPIEEKK